MLLANIDLLALIGITFQSSLPYVILYNGFKLFIIMTGLFLFLFGFFSLVSNFKNYSRIPSIELDLALSRLRNVYDLLLMFREDAQAGTTIPPVSTGKNKPEISDKELVHDKTTSVINP